jgi:hypothetical protein
LIGSYRENILTKEISMLIKELGWWTRTLPLGNRRDVWVRLWMRLVWCTIPYFAVALYCAAWGDMSLLIPPIWVIPVLVPIAGLILDSRRIRSKLHPST